MRRPDTHGAERRSAAGRSRRRRAPLTLRFFAPLGLGGAEGAFDGALKPTVLVCEWSGSRCERWVAAWVFGISRGAVVDHSAEVYRIDWNTASFPLEPARTYRLRVMLDRKELGHVDLRVVRTEAEAAAVDRASLVPLVAGTTLPIRFRLSRPSDGTVVGPEGGSVTSDGSGARVAILPGTFTTGREVQIRDSMLPPIDFAPLSLTANRVIVPLTQLGPAGGVVLDFRCGLRPRRAWRRTSGCASRARRRTTGPR